MTGAVGAIGRFGGLCTFHLDSRQPTQPTNRNPVADRTRYSGEVSWSEARPLGKHLRPPLGAEIGWCPTASWAKWEP